MTTHALTRKRAAGILAAITMTAVMAACSASDSGGDASTGSADTSEAVAESSDGGATREFGGARERSADDSVPSEAEQAPAGETGSSGQAPQMERALISSGTVSLESPSVAEARREVQRVVDAQGGEITEESTETDDAGDTSYVRLVVRVPSGRFSAAMEALEGVATLRQSSRGSEDVTTQVIDTGVRVRAQEASLKRVEMLLAQARSLKDIIWIESQLTRRQADLDSLKSQATWLEDQTSQSTITVDISLPTTQAIEQPEDDEPAGFLGGLRGGMRALAAAWVAIATIAGALLPFAIVLGVIGLPTWLLVRRGRRTTAPETPVPAAPEA